MNALKSNKRSGAQRQQDLEVLLGVLPKKSSNQRGTVASLYTYCRQHDALGNFSRTTSGSTLSMSTETFVFGRSGSDSSHAAYPLAESPKPSRLGLFTVAEGGSYADSSSQGGESVIEDANTAGSPVLSAVPRITSKLMQRRGSL